MRTAWVSGCTSAFRLLSSRRKACQRQESTYISRLKAKQCAVFHFLVAHFTKPAIPTAKPPTSDSSCFGKREFSAESCTPQTWPGSGASCYPCFRLSSTLNPKPETLNPKPRNPKPEGLGSLAGLEFRARLRS